MGDYNKSTYNREYNKDTYKTVKVYIREEEYPAIVEHMKQQGYTKLSGYIKDLINRDMELSNSPGDKTSISVQNHSGKVIVGDIGGDVHM